MFKKLTFVITFIWAIYAVKSLPAYPPCVSCNCIGNQCAGNGMFPLWAKLEWSELTGTHEKDAVAQVKKGNPFITPVVIYKQVTHITDNCCNRVWILVDQPGGNGIITNIPAVG
ncbi:hypothetical protein A4A49_19452 [Nicotiana attenuata]|uniref:Serine protease inhibitor, potato inhibitor I-type family protein n=1 Tax=Nicotiana attenuata TaxID=49451 RepID=A0A314L6W9_NICAT|nr:hypothetical protein A4A49_19452 [Nicotiana attenuata]